ncbi:MAG: hypothetical protein JKY34_06985 [Kordiimonadaceae bacterium]|nr:hypothetical protein [Kordiimonadaceae bacterium]
MTHLGHRVERGLKLVKSGAIVAVSSLALSACMGGTSPNVWQGQEVLVEGRQTVLEQDVYTVSDNHRELKDRFDALERLYVELVKEMRSREQHMKDLAEHVNKVQKDPKIAATLKKVGSDVSAMRREMKTLENRLFTVELSDQVSTSTKQMVAPTGASETGASVARSSGAAGTPVSAVAPSQQVFYGVHLASYRSDDQVSSGWTGLEQSFGTSLNGLTPLIYTQSQEGIGTFLRLIAGPLISEQEATELCGRIRENASEQYCRVTEYQGEPIG